MSCGAYIRQSWGEDLFCGDLNEYRKELCKECLSQNPHNGKEERK